MVIISATLAIDVGASKIAGALFDSKMRILHEVSKSSRNDLYSKADPNLDITKSIILELLEIAKENNISVANGGACFAEYVTPDQYLNSNDQIEWKIQPKEDFSALTGFNWIIESDVRAMALAEADINRDLNNFIFITVSSGISHAFVIDGKPWAGATGEAIGFGVNQIDNSQESPTLEQFSSGLGIARRFQRETESEIKSAINVFEIYENDLQAQKVVNSAADVLGKSIATLVDFFDPSEIIIGGGLWLGSALYRDLVLESYKRNVTKRRAAPEIKSSNSGKNAALIGAALAAN